MHPPPEPDLSGSCNLGVLFQRARRRAGEVCHDAPPWPIYAPTPARPHSDPVPPGLCPPYKLCTPWLRAGKGQSNPGPPGRATYRGRWRARKAVPARSVTLRVLALALPSRVAPDAVRGGTVRPTRGRASLQATGKRRPRHAAAPAERATLALLRPRRASDGTRIDPSRGGRLVPTVPGPTRPVRSPAREPPLYRAPKSQPDTTEVLRCRLKGSKTPLVAGTLSHWYYHCNRGLG